jgi:hypothetical protein
MPFRHGRLNRIASDQMKFGGVLAQVAGLLGKSERGIAKELGLSVAALRSLDGPACPPYLRLALAAMVLGINPDKVLSRSAASSPPHSRDQLTDIAPEHSVNASEVAHLDRSLDD